MHHLDANGSIHAYRVARDRKEMWRSIGFGLACGTALMAGVVLVFVALSLTGR